MNVKPSSKSAVEREMPHTDLLMGLTAVFFMVLIFVDSALHLTTFLDAYIEDWVQYVAGGLVLAIGILGIVFTHRVLFTKDHKAPDAVISTGIFSHLRHPLYSSVLLVFGSAVVMTCSLLGLGFIAGCFLLYDRMASYEERVLEEMFGTAYVAYKQQVPKWIPRLRSA